MSRGESARSEGPLTPLETLGERIWLVLGGGGLKGLAHVGVWRALVERDVRIEGIVGTSVGALVGALAASGLGLDELDARAHGVTRRDLVRINRRVAWINGIRQTSVFKGDTLRTFLDGQLPSEGWAALRLPVHMNAVELGTGGTEWFGPETNAGVSLLDAVHASCSLPVLFPPVDLNGKAYVDGGVEHPVPIERAAELGATGIIAVDAGAGERGDVDQVLARGLVGVHQRVFTIMSWRRRRDMMAQWDGPPLLYVRPRLAGYDTFDFEHVRYFVDEGYRAMVEALE